MTHICVSKLTNIGSDNGLLPVWRQAIIWTNAGILPIRSQGTYFNEISIKIQNIFIQENTFENVFCQMATIFPGLNVLTGSQKLPLLLVLVKAKRLIQQQAIQ